MAIRRRQTVNGRKLAAALYKRAAKHRALAQYLYKLAEDAEAGKDVQTGTEVAPPKDVPAGAGKPDAAPAKSESGSAPADSSAAAGETSGKGTSVDFSSYLPAIGGSIAGAGVGGLATGGLARLFLGDEEKARKWILLSALLGAAAGGLAGGYGMNALMNLYDKAPPAAT